MKNKILTWTLLARERPWERGLLDCGLMAFDDLRDRLWVMALRLWDRVICVFMARVVVCGLDRMFWVLGWPYGFGLMSLFVSILFCV